jgi:2-isopropylmalate synthase
LALVDYQLLPNAPGGRLIEATVRHDGAIRRIEGRGNGPIDAFVEALRRDCRLDFAFIDYREHAITAGASAKAAAYAQIRAADGTTLFGVGIDENIVTASLQAVASAAARLVRMENSV